MSIITIGIDLAKNIFAVHGVNESGKAELVKPKVQRDQLLPLIANLPPCLIGMEACTGAHHWARLFRQHGHTVRLIAPKFVTPYRMAASAARTTRRTPPPSAKPSPGPRCVLSRSRTNTSRPRSPCTAPGRDSSKNAPLSTTAFEASLPNSASSCRKRSNDYPLSAVSKPTPSRPTLRHPLRNMLQRLIHLIDQDQAQVACLQSSQRGVNGEEFAGDFFAFARAFGVFQAVAQE